MDRNETMRLMLLIRERLGERKKKMTRLAGQLDDTTGQHVPPAMWDAFSPAGIADVGEVPSEKMKDYVVACVTIAFGERPVSPDNKIGACAWGCGRMIQWRPYLDDALPKICLYCMVDRLAQGDDQ